MSIIYKSGFLYIIVRAIETRTKLEKADVDFKACCFTEVSPVQLPGPSDVHSDDNLLHLLLNVSKFGIEIKNQKQFVVKTFSMGKAFCGFKYTGMHFIYMKLGEKTREISLLY